jgi:hypothetical protein
MAPRFLPGGIPGDRIALTRLAEMFYPYHRQSGAERFLHGPGRILTLLFWRATCELFRLRLKMPAVMVPDQLLPAGIETIGVAQEFYDVAARGRLLLRRDAISAFTGGTELLLVSGNRIDADVVIFATGWRQPLRFLAPELQSTVRQDGHFGLYRHILPPTEQRLGFVGYASTVACQLTSEISAHWLSQSFRGDLALPSADAMRAEVERVKAWLAEIMPARPEGYHLGPYLAHHINELIADMGLPTRRTSNRTTEYLAPFRPARYRTLAEERRLREGDDRRPRASIASARHAPRRATRPGVHRKLPLASQPAVKDHDRLPPARPAFRSRRASRQSRRRT